VKSPYAPFPSLSIVVPVYNERKTVAEVLWKLTQLPLDDVEIIVVDGDSNDGTQDILREAERDDPRIRVIYQTERNGRGAAIKEGAAAATKDYLLFQDADLELNPSEIPKLFEPIQAGRTDVVFGSRFLGNGIFVFGMSPMAFLANMILTMATRALYDVYVTDVATCYILLPRTMFLAMDFRCDGWDFTFEAIGKLVKDSRTFIEVPVAYVPRRYLDGKKIEWRAGFTALFVLFKVRFNKL